MIGETLSHFRILDKLGEGGMGVVYRAEDERLGRNVALKVLQPGAVGNEERRLRFIREARTAASISHPNIAAIHEIDETEAGTVFIAMELVDGRTLAEALDAGPVPLREALRFAIEIAEALGRAHELGIVHRDLKPDNVMVRPDGHVKILDFGLAKLREAREAPPSRTTPHDKTLSLNVTRDGRVMGTANYMSPEQARGLDVDPRSDLFSFGTLLYEMVTGRRPFEAATVTDTLSAITRDAPVAPTEIDPSIPLELERLILKCLEKNPADRYQHADDIAVDLRRLRRESDSQTMHSGRFPALAAPKRRAKSGPRAVWLAAGLVALVGAGMGLRALVLGERPGGGGSASDVRAIAVMPIENLTDSSDASQLGRILQELIITDLSGIEVLRVFSSQRLYDLRKQFPGGDVERIDGSVATRVAREAGASAMLTGSLSQLGEQWMLTVQLVELDDGSVTKSERIRGSDLYQMVDELTSRMRDELGVDQTLELTSVREKTTESIEAWKHYVDGVEQLNHRNMPEAVAALERAVEVDPAFGQAYIKLAVAKWWSQEQNAYGGTSESTAASVLRELLEGSIKLSSRERLLAQALEPLVAFDYRTAKPLFERLVEKHPDEKDAWYGLGEAIRHGPGGMLDAEGVAAFERALDLDPTLGVAYVHVEEHYRALGRHDEAERKVRDLIERTHGAPEWQFVLARWLLRDGKRDEALALGYEAAEKIEDPAARVDALMTLGQTFMVEQDDMDAVEALIETAAGLEVPERAARVDVARGLHAAALGEYEAAELHFRRALEADPRSVPALNGLFNALLERQRFEEAFAEARSRAQADHRLPYYHWIFSAALLGNRAEHDRAMDEALGTAKTPQEKRWALVSAADGALEIGDVTAAQAWLDQARATEEGSQLESELADRFARCARERGDHAKTLELIQVALDRFPDEPELMLEVAAVELERGRYEEAERQARRVLGLSPRFAAAWAIVVAARVLGGGGGEEKAMDEALAALTLPRDRLLFYRDVAVAYEAADRWPVAEDLAHRAAEIDTRRYREIAPRALAFAQAQQGRHEEALATLAAALEQPHPDPELSMLRAWIDLQAGRPEQAERQLRALLDRGPRRLFHQSLAYALAAQGKFREAEAEARRAVAMARTQPALTALAWVLIEGDLDLDEGTALAEEAQRVPASLSAQAAPAFQASPEHALGLARMKRGDWAAAVPLLERTARERPDRARIREHLAQARAHL